MKEYTHPEIAFTMLRTEDVITMSNGELFDGSDVNGVMDMDGYIFS